MRPTNGLESRTTCNHGHPFDEANTFLKPDGSRGCRKCRSAASARYAAARREWLERYKREQGCIDCGTREGRLDLDHRPGEVKLFDLSKARVPWPRLHAELAKCDVRCISCHSKRHGLERGSLLPSRELAEEMAA